MKIQLTKRCISINDPCFLIAEVGQAHDGSFELAHSYIDAIAEAGADAVKFQTHIAEAESTKHEEFRVPDFFQDKSRFDYWKRMEFRTDQWASLYDHANDVGLEFLSTPFSVEAVNLLENLGVKAWKLGSGDTTNSVLIEKLIETKKPILVSSGMSTYEEIDKIVNMIKKEKISYALLQCTTSYPCPPEEIGFNVIKNFIEEYDCPVGLSDHSGEIFPSLAAVTMGAKLIEVHVTFSKESYGPDVSSSLTFNQLKELSKGINFLEKGLNLDIDKNKQSEIRKDTKKLFARSAFYCKKILKGEKLSREHIAMKKPGGGLDYENAMSFIGKKVIYDKEVDDFIDSEDFNE